MKEEINYAFSNLENAFIKLKEGIDKAKDELEKDGVIQRFEFTFELFWKALKIFLQNSGIDTKTPKESLKEAFKIGWLKEEKTFLDMLEDRNKTAHIYDKATSEEIFKRIKNNYIQVIAEVLEELRKTQ
ncbi:MAG: nucleotidyltransferase substrate binding protein [Candidatus Omnitrophica bacterium]|nr:nucleotidyltransferase substrate binding protein [Candidatus Omnitrophota bacterium]